MIAYRLETRSGLAPYLQIVQQTRDALRLGLLRPGDKLPTVKEVVGSIAIDPTTSFTVGSLSPGRSSPSRRASLVCWTICRYGASPERVSSRYAIITSSSLFP